MFLAAGQFRRALQNTELKLYAAILATASVGMAVFMFARSGSEDSLWRTFTYSAFNAISVMTTTGFMCDDYQKWPPMTHSVFFALMLIGGCSGSTSGGIKVSRFALSFALCRNHIENPSGRESCAP